MSKTFLDDIQRLIARQLTNFGTFLKDETSGEFLKPPIDSKLVTKLSSKIVIALDIGSSKIVMLVGRMNPKKFVEVLGFSETPSDGVTRGVVSNILKTTAAIKKVLVDIHKNTDISVLQVCVNISGPLTNFYQRGILIRPDWNEDISNDDIGKLKRDISKVQLPPGHVVVFIEPAHYIVDGEPEIKDPVGMSGIRIEADFLVLTAADSSVKNLYRCLATSNLYYLPIIPGPIASAEGVLCEVEKEEGVAVLDFGAGVTCIAIYENGVVNYAEVIPLGGNSITNDLKHRFGLLYKQAELLKQKYGAAMVEGISKNEYINMTPFAGKRALQVSKREVAEVIQSRLEELIGLAYSSIVSALAGRKLQFGIVLTGGTSTLPHLKKLVEEITGLECYIGSPDIQLAENTLLAPELFIKLKSPMYAVSVGLLKMGLERMEDY